MVKRFFLSHYIKDFLGDIYTVKFCTFTHRLILSKIRSTHFLNDLKTRSRSQTTVRNKVEKRGVFNIDEVLATTCNNLNPLLCSFLFLFLNVSDCKLKICIVYFGAYFLSENTHVFIIFDLQPENPDGF